MKEELLHQINELEFDEMDNQKEANYFLKKIVVWIIIIIITFWSVARFYFWR